MHYTSLTWIFFTVKFITQYLLTPVSRSGFYFLGVVAVLRETTLLFSSKFTNYNWSYIKWCPAFSVLQSYYQWLPSCMPFPNASLATSLSEAPLFSLLKPRLHSTSRAHICHSCTRWLRARLPTDRTPTAAGCTGRPVCSCTFNNRRLLVPCHPHRRGHSLIPPLHCDNFHRPNMSHGIPRLSFILPYDIHSCLPHLWFSSPYETSDFCSLILLVCLHDCPSFYPSAWKNLAATERTFIKFDIWVL